MYQASATAPDCSGQPNPLSVLGKIASSRGFGIGETSIKRILPHLIRPLAGHFRMAEMIGTGDLNAPLGVVVWAHARLSLCIR